MIWLIFTFILGSIEAKKEPTIITGININGIKVPYNLTDDEKNELTPIVELNPEEIHKKPIFYTDAIQKLPLKARSFNISFNLDLLKVRHNVKELEKG